MKAPRALPMVSGPVGFADTNSTLTVRAEIGSTCPHAPGSARMPSTIDSTAAGRMRMLTNPGGATSAASIGEGDPSADRISHELRGEERGELDRRPAVGPGELHREVRREVAVGRVCRPFDLDRGSRLVVYCGYGAIVDCAAPMPGRRHRGPGCATGSGSRGHRTGAARRLGHRYQCASWVVRPGVPGGPFVAGRQRNRARLVGGGENGAVTGRRRY